MKEVEESKGKTSQEYIEAKAAYEASTKTLDPKLGCDEAKKKQKTEDETQIGDTENKLEDDKEKVEQLKAKLNTLERQSLSHTSLKDMYLSKETKYGNYEIRDWNVGEHGRKPGTLKLEKEWGNTSYAKNINKSKHKTNLDIVTGTDGDQQPPPKSALRISEVVDVKETLNPTVIKYKLNTNEPNIIDMYKNAKYTYYIFEFAAMKYIDVRFNEVEEGRMDGTNNRSRLYMFSGNNFKDIELLDMKFMRNRNIILEFCIYKQGGKVKVCRLLYKKYTSNLTGYSSGKVISRLKQVKIIKQDDNFKLTETDDDFSLYVEGDYNTNNSRIYNYCYYDYMNKVDDIGKQTIYSISSDKQVYVYTFGDVEGFVAIVDAEGERVADTNAKGKKEEKKIGRKNYSNIADFGDVINYFKFVTNNNLVTYYISEYYINNEYEIFARITSYIRDGKSIKQIAVNPSTGHFFKVVNVKGNNMYNDYLSLNKAQYMKEVLLNKSKVRVSETEYDSVDLGGINFKVEETFEIVNDNDSLIARCKITEINEQIGSIKKFKITGAGPPQKITLGHKQITYTGEGSIAGINLIESMIDNRKSMIEYESDVIVYSDLNETDKKQKITLMNGILLDGGKIRTIDITNLKTMCRKIVRTFEPYNNMNKLFYLIDDKVYSQQPLAGPKANLTLNLEVDSSYILQEVKCIIMGFTPSSGGEDKSEDKTTAQNNNKTNGVELNELTNPNKYSEISLDSIEQLEATHDEVIIRGMCKTFKCVGIWDAQYNVFKIYFFNPFMLSSGGFHYDIDYQIDELIVDTTIDIVDTRIINNKYIGLEDDGVLPTNKFIKYGNSNTSVIDLDETGNTPNLIPRLSKYEIKEDRTIRDTTGKIGSEGTNSFSFMSGGDNIPDSYAMTYIIKK